MAEPQRQRMTPDEFYEWQKRQDKNYELIDGVPHLPLKALTGATRAHDRITVRALSLLSEQLASGPCEPTTQDIAVRIPRGNVRRPDVLIDCGPYDPASVEAAEPRVIIEVLSPSTFQVDRFRKLEEYKTHPAIRVIMLIDTRMADVGLWRRSDSDWQVEDYRQLDKTIELPEVNAALRLNDLYRGFVFE